MKRCQNVCVGCCWFGDYEEDGEDALNYICLGNDHTWYSKKEYGNVEVPDDCPYQALHDSMQVKEDVV
jgi:hypothetical protein